MHCVHSFSPAQCRDFGRWKPACRKQEVSAELYKGLTMWPWLLATPCNSLQLLTSIVLAIPLWSLTCWTDAVWFLDVYNLRAALACCSRRSRCNRGRYCRYLISLNQEANLYKTNIFKHFCTVRTRFLIRVIWSAKQAWPRQLGNLCNSEVQFIFLSCFQHSKAAMQ